jgi:hypothetical protein
LKNANCTEEATIMSASGPGPSPSAPSAGHHIATVSHDGRFWDVYVEFEDDPRRPDTYRALLCYAPADPGDGEEGVRTGVIIIEDSFEEAMMKARSLRDVQLQALLRSALP